MHPQKRAKLLRTFNEKCQARTGGDDIHEDVYEKWLRRRIDYAAIRETGNHAAPGLIHTLVHSGDSHNAVASELRHEMWRSNKYPESNFFLHGVVLYRYPDIVKENLDLRFSKDRDPRTRPSETPGYINTRNVYDLNFKEVATVPNWVAPMIVSRCPLPHTLETPMTWPLGKEQPKTPSQCPYRTCVSDALFPACCHRKDNVCSSVYCHEPVPEAVYNTGPMGRGDALVKWHIGMPPSRQ